MSNVISSQGKSSIIELLNQGYCTLQIAKKTQIAAPTVSRFVHKVLTQTNDNTAKSGCRKCKRDFEGELIARYKKSDQEITTKFLIKKHNVTRAAAERICEKLKA